MKGCYPSFCSLGAITWLSERIPDAYFIVVGTETCSHFLSVTVHPYRFPRAEFTTLVLEERDVSLGNYEESLMDLIQGLHTEFAGKTVFLLNTCATRILQLDIGSVVRRLNESYPERFYNVKTSGLTTAYTEGEDLLVESYLRTLPVRDGCGRAVFLGVVDDEIQREITAQVDAECLFLPEFTTDLELRTKDTFIPIHPYLGHSTTYLRRQGLMVLDAGTPVGTVLTNDFYGTIAHQFGTEHTPLAGDEPLRGDYALMADNLYEPALAEYIFRNGGNVVYASTPGPNGSLTASPDSLEELEHLFTRPVDVVICPNEYAGLLNKRGIATIWSLKFLNGNIYGYCGAQRLHSIFDHPESRRQSHGKSYEDLVK
ncbi:MAG: nitrogenase component 1 [Nanobdellota archaeon]